MRATAMITVPLDWAYAGLCSGLVLDWIVLYAFFPKARRAQVRVSLVFLVLASLDVLHNQDYWQPPKHFAVQVFGGTLGLEDLLFGLAFGGVIAALVAILSPRQATPTDWQAAIAKAAAVYLLTLVLWAAGINSLFAVAIGALLVVALALALDFGKAWRVAIGAGCAVVLLFLEYFLGFLVASNADAMLQSIWLLYDTPLGVRLVGVPITELVWAFAVGALIAIL